MNNSEPKKYGRLTLLEPEGLSKAKHRCQCDCGTIRHVRLNDLRTGNTKSCGCLYRELAVTRNRTHGMRPTPIYTCWRHMKARCYNTKSLYYSHYGGRGIKMCQRWRDSFAAFYADMSPRPEGLSIDRINNDGDYEPGNCRWATRTMQSQNTRLLGATNTSGYRGVGFYKGKEAWQAYISVHNKQVYLGTHTSALEAAVAYDQYVIENRLEHTLNGVYTTPIFPPENDSMPAPKKKVSPISATGKVRLNILMQANVLTAAKALSQRRGTTVSEVIRMAVREYVIRELKKEKEA